MTTSPWRLTMLHAPCCDTSSLVDASDCLIGMYGYMIGPTNTWNKNIELSRIKIDALAKS